MGKIKEALLNGDDFDFNSHMRVFDTGATRNSDTGKVDFDGFLSVAVLRSYGDYMNKNRTLEDGSYRRSDNWKLGINKEQYVKSMYRHFFDVVDANGSKGTIDAIEPLNALLFNVMGLLHEHLKDKQNGQR